MRRYRSLAVLLAVTVLTACGAAEKLSPRVAVRDAARATTSQKEGTFTLSVVGSEADMNTLFNHGTELSAEDREGLNLLRNGHIAFSTGAGKFGLDVKAGDLDHAVELRMIDKKLYARADIAGIAKLAGSSPEQVTGSIRGMASQAGFGFLSAAAAGRWIVADLSTLGGLFDKFGQQFGVGTGAGAPTGSTVDPQAASRYQVLRDAIGKAFSEDISVTKLGSDSVGDHYLGTVASLRGFYAKVRPALMQEMGMLSNTYQLPPDSALPDRPASLDIWVKSGRVSRLELGLAQFLPAPPQAGPVAIRLDIDGEAAALTAPSDAVNVDIAGIIQKFAGQFTNQFGGLLGGVGGIRG